MTTRFDRNDVSIVDIDDAEAGPLNDRIAGGEAGICGEEIDRLA